ncbi:MAG: Ig-like domain-containing protein, partial [Candidatus Diapherotrites archaeon]
MFQNIRFFRLFSFFLMFSVLFLFAFSVAPTATVTYPSAGKYLKSGAQIIDFSVTDEDVNGIAGKELRVEVYYSTIKESFQNFLGDYNLSDVNAGYCPSNNFASSVNCRVRVLFPSVPDGRYYFDLNFYEIEGSEIKDFNKISSDVFYADNTEPQITVLEPNISCDGNVSSNVNRIRFDVNDFDSGVSRVVVEITGAQRDSNFLFSLFCSTTNNSLSYSCDYNEQAIDRNGTYDVTIKAYDRAESPTELSNFTTCNFRLNYSDTTPPESPAGLVGFPGPASIALTWFANKEYDINGYRIYYKTTDCNFTKQTGIFAGFTKQTNYVLQDLNSDLNYYIRISAVDYTGNESELSDCNRTRPAQRQLLPAPEFSSTTHSNNTWSKDRNAVITWSSVAGASGYSCTWDTNASKEPDQTIDTNTYCVNRLFDVNDLKEGIYYLKVRACVSNGNCGNIGTFTVKIDFTKPSSPKNLEASLERNGYVRLTWEASTDNKSGIKEYRIYRGTSSDFNVDENNRRAILVDTTWTDTQTKAGIKYYYKVIAFDNAGNASDPASVSITTKSLSIVIDVPPYISKGSHSVRIRATEELIDAYVYIKKATDSSWIKIKGPITDDDFTANFYVESGDDGIAKIKVLAYNLEETIESFEIDTKEPKVTWLNPSPGENLSGTYTLKVKLDEPSTRLESVSFYYDGNKIATVTKASEDGTYWVASWDTSNVPKGGYSLKAVAIDKAGNEGSA